MLLLDQNISYKVARQLAIHFHGIVHVSDVKLLNASDEQIWEYARTHLLAIVTFDSDFLNISLLRGIPPKIILLKTGNRKTQALINLLIDQQSSITAFLTGETFEEIACLEIT